MRPHATGSAHAGLHFIGNEGGTVRGTQASQRTEELRAGVAVAAFPLNRLDDQGRYGIRMRDEAGFHFSQRCRFIGRILSLKIRQGETVGRKGHHWPIERRKVQLVHGLGPGGRERPKAATVEAPGKRDHLHRIGTPLPVSHAVVQLGLGRSRPPPLTRRERHKSHLERILHRLGPRRDRNDMCHAGRRDAHQRLHDVYPLGRHRNPQRGAKACTPIKATRSPSVEEIRVVVPKRERRDVPIHVKQPISIDIHNVVSKATLSVLVEMDGTRILDRAVAGKERQRPGSRNRGEHARGGRFAGDDRGFDRHLHPSTRRDDGFAVDDRIGPTRLILGWVKPQDVRL